MVQFVAPGSATQVLVATILETAYLALVAVMAPFEDASDSFFSLVLQVGRSSSVLLSSVR